jgi:hypothetical protein
MVTESGSVDDSYCNITVDTVTQECTIGSPLYVSSFNTNTLSPQSAVTAKSFRSPHSLSGVALTMVDDRGMYPKLLSLTTQSDRGIYWELLLGKFGLDNLCKHNFIAVHL